MSAARSPKPKLPKEPTATSSFIRVQRDRDHPYTIINATFPNDERLSFAARGVLAYLLTKPDDWQIRTSDLINKSPAGRDAVYSMLKELKALGYMVQRQCNDGHGKLCWETRVCEVPQQDAESEAQPFPEKPYMVKQPFPGLPYTVQPDTVKPEIYESLKEQIIKSGSIKGSDDDDSVSSDGIDSVQSPTPPAPREPTALVPPSAIRSAWALCSTTRLTDDDVRSVRHTLGNESPLERWQEACTVAKQRAKGPIRKYTYVLKVAGSLREEGESAPAVPPVDDGRLPETNPSTGLTDAKLREYAANMPAWLRATMEVA